jgi:hypothetical protein
MAYIFRCGDRDQPFLLPHDLRDWLAADHLVWFVLDVVDQLDLGPFRRSYCADGHGHPAYDLKLLLGVLLYGYCLGVRSSRQIQRRCTEGLAFRGPCRQADPGPRDHRAVPGPPPAGAGRVPGRLAAAVRRRWHGPLRTVALDGTKVAANAATTASHTHGRIEAEVAEILRQAAEADQREDLEHGDARGDELPEALASKAGRLARLRQAKAQLEAAAAERERQYEQRVAELAAAARTKGRPPAVAWSRPATAGGRRAAGPSATRSGPAAHRSGAARGAGRRGEARAWAAWAAAPPGRRTRLGWCRRTRPAP